MSQFHETRMGMDHYLKNFPRLVNAAERIANALEGKPASGVPNHDNDNTPHCCILDAGNFTMDMASASSGGVIVMQNGETLVFMDAETSGIMPYNSLVELVSVVLSEKINNTKIKSIDAMFVKDNKAYIVFFTQ